MGRARLAEDQEIEVSVMEPTDGTMRVEFNKLFGTTNDQFLRVPRELLNASQKRQATKLQKAYNMGVNPGLTSPSQIGQVNYVGTDPSAYTTTKGGAKPKYLTPEQIYNGYFIWHLATPPYDMYYLQDLTYANYTHYSCIRAKVTNIVGLGHNWQPTQKVKAAKQDALEADKQSNSSLAITTAQSTMDGEDADPNIEAKKSKKVAKLSRKLAQTMEDLDNHLESLNMQEAFIDTLTKIWMDVESTGNGYMEVGRNRDGSIGYLGHIPSYSMRVRVPRDGFVQMLPSQLNQLVFFRNYGDTKTADIFGKDPNPNEVIHFKKESPKNAYYGIPDIIAALPAVAGDKFAAEYNLEYFENKAVPRYALIVKGAKLSAQSERRILEYFRKEVKGKHHGTLYIPVPATAGTNVDVKLEPIEAEPQEFSFGSYRIANRTEIRMVHRVPGSQLGDNSGGADAGQSAAMDNLMFKEQVTRPEQTRVEWKLNLIIKSFTDMFTFRFTELDLVDEETKSRIHDRYIRMGAINPNEVREDLGKAPRDGGDEFLNPTQQANGDSNLNLQGLGSPQNPNNQPMDPNNPSKPGPTRKTNEGSPKNNKNGSVRTPATSTKQGKAIRGTSKSRAGEAASSIKAKPKIRKEFNLSEVYPYDEQYPYEDDYESNLDYD